MSAAGNSAVVISASAVHSTSFFSPKSLQKHHELLLEKALYTSKLLLLGSDFH